MKRRLSSLAAVVGLAALQGLSPQLASAGDAPAHTAAMLAAAHVIAQSAEFSEGVGAPLVDGLRKGGKFKIPIPEGFPSEGVSSDPDGGQCWSCPTPDPESCAESCLLGAAVNEPDHWSCMDPRQPPTLTTLNSQASPFQPAIAALASGDNVAMACNYSHFASNNSPSGLNAADVLRLTLDWAQEIPDAIARDGETPELACELETFEKYVARVANALHFAQDAESEHHAAGNLVCRVDELLPPLIPGAELIDLAQGAKCRNWAELEVLDLDSDSVCDDEVVEYGSRSAAVLKLSSGCAGGSPHSCTGLERLLRHHCDLEGTKKLKCSGKKHDHYQQEGKGYCEGARFPGGGEDFVEKASAASQQHFENAMRAWATVCQEPAPGG